MTSPTFSVIIPTLNEEKFLPLLLESLSEQGERNFEVIVVDGSSQDATVSIAKRFQKKLPSLQILTGKRGLPYQRNSGAKVAKGKWLVFVDADSVFLPYFFSETLVYIDTYKPRVFTTWARPDSESVNDALITLFYLLIIEGSLLVKRHITPGPLAIVRADVFKSVGGYDETREFNEDMDLGLRLQKAGHPLFILRQSLYIWSLRRFRSEGTLKILHQYALASIVVLLRNKPLSRMPGYVMGGHLYGKRRQKQWQHFVADLNKKIRSFFDDLRNSL